MSAVQLKEQGNKAFISKEYKKAIDLYTSAITIDQFNPILYSNRAQCFINLQNYQSAYTDCIKGLDLSHNNTNNNANIPVLIKLNFRKGIALKGLKKYKSAKESFESVLKLDPSNNPAILEIKNLSSIQENNLMDIDVNIPIEEVDELPEFFSKILKPPQDNPITELKTNSSTLDKEINELFGSKKIKEPENESLNKPIDQTPNVELNEKLPMHFLTALKQLPDNKKSNGYKYVLNLDSDSYQTIFESGIDTEFLLFFLDAVNYASTQNDIPNWNTLILNHLKQFSTFKRYDLAMLMCDDSVKKSILHNVEQKHPEDLANYRKYIE